jgi:hypothetical protein
VYIRRLERNAMKTARLTLLTTPEFKAYLGAEAERGGVSVAELVRRRCEQKPTEDEEALSALTEELRNAVRDAQASLEGGLAEAALVVAELRKRRAEAAPSDIPAPALPKPRRLAAKARA